MLGSTVGLWKSSQRHKYKDVCVLEHVFMASDEIAEVTSAVLPLVGCHGEETTRAEKHETRSAAAVIEISPLPLVGTAATQFINYPPSSLCHSPVRMWDVGWGGGWIFPRHVLKIKRHCTCSEY